MDPFNENAVCPKCAGKDIATIYRVKSTYTICRYYDPPEGEFFHRGCRRCHFNWPEACLTEADMKKMTVDEFVKVKFPYPPMSWYGFRPVTQTEVTATLNKYKEALEEIRRSIFNDCCERTLDKYEIAMKDGPQAFECDECETSWDLMYYPTGRTPMQIATDVLREMKDDNHEVQS